MGHGTDSGGHWAIGCSRPSCILSFLATRAPRLEVAALYRASLAASPPAARRRRRRRRHRAPRRGQVAAQRRLARPGRRRPANSRPAVAPHLAAPDPSIGATPSRVAWLPRHHLAARLWCQIGGAPDAGGRPKNETFELTDNDCYILKAVGASGL